MTRRILQKSLLVLMVASVSQGSVWAQFFGGAVGQNSTTTSRVKPEVPAHGPVVDRTKIEIPDEPKTIDPATLVPAGLATSATVTFMETSLKDVAAWLQTELKTPVLLDREGLNDEGVLISEPVTDQLQNEPVYLMLDRLRGLLLSWYVEAGLIHITTQAKADEHLVTVSYNLGDLFDAGYDPTAILSTIEAGTSGQWDTVDGVGGDLVLLGDVLFARQTHHVQRELAGLLTALRKHARRTFTNDPPQHEPLRAKLQQLITIDFQDTALSEVMTKLEQLAELRIRIDHAALKNEGVRLRMPITLKLSEQKLETVLRVLLSQHQLSAVLENGALSITTVARADEIMKTAVFDVRDLCQDESESSSLAQAIMSQTGADDKIVFAKPGVTVIRQPEQTLDDVLRLLENYRLALKQSKPRPLRSIDPQEVLIRYYRLPTAMATELERTLPELVKSESWQTAQQTEAIGTIRRVVSKPGLLNAGPSSTSNPWIEHSVLIVKQTRAIHKEIGELLQKLDSGDTVMEMPTGTGAFGGGGFGGQGGFGGGFPSVKNENLSR